MVALFVLLQSAVLKNVAALCLYDIIHLAGDDLLFYLLEHHCLQENNRHRYGRDDAAFLEYDFKTGQVYNDFPLHVNRKYKTSSRVIVDVRFTKFEVWRRSSSPAS